MNPKNLYVVTKKSCHIGYQSTKGCSVFTFLKPQHAVQVSQYVNNKCFNVKKMHPSLYVIHPLKHKNHDLTEILVQTVEPEEFVLEMAVNMVKLELVDDVIDNGKELILSSNYDLGISLELDEDMIKKRLNALYEEKNFTAQLYEDLE